MDRSEREALDLAKEITIAALKDGNRFPGDSGVAVVDYFETVYNKALEVFEKILTKPC